MRWCVPVLFLLASACWPDSSGIDPPSDRFFFPTGVALTASGRYLVVANSNFDLRYNAGTVVTVDLDAVDQEIREGCDGRCREARDETPFLVPNGTVAVGSLVSDMTLSPDGSRVYLTVRGNASLTWLEIDETDGAARVLSCSAGGQSGATRCDADHEVIRTGDLWAPPEPYALLADEDWVVTTHVDTGRVSLFDVSDGREPALARVLDIFPTGSNGLARHPVTGWYYLVSRDSDRVYPFTVSMPARQAGEGPAVSTDGSILLYSNEPGTDSRSIVFSPDGSRAYVTNRAPASVVVLDTSVRPDGRANGTVIDTLEIGLGASRLAIQPLPDGGYLVLAVCFDAERLFVIDPDLRAVVRVIPTGAGPHLLAPDAARGRAYLANFGESTLWVLDFDPDSPNFGENLISIGLPEIPSRND